MRKLVAVLLVMMLVLGLASTASARKPYTLDIYWIANRDDAAIRTQVEQAINQYTMPAINATVSIHLIPWDPVWTEVAVSDLMADKKIDLIFTADWEGYVEEVLAGKLTPLDIDLLPEYGGDILETLPADFLEGVRFNEYVYAIPTNKELCVPSGLIVNKTAAEAIGWDPVKDPVKTTAELEPWLAKYKEMFPGRYPYLMERGRWADEPWGPDWIGIEQNAISMKYARQEDGEFDETIYSIYETPEQEEHIRLMFDWARKGYIAPDAATYDYNKIFGTGDFLVFCQPLKGNNIKSMEMYAANKVPYVPDFECVEIILQEKYRVTCQAGGSMFAIPASSRRKEVAMQFLNLMHSDPELVNLLLYGEENVNYTKIDENTVRINPDANWYGLHGGAWTVGNTTLQMVVEGEIPEKNYLLQAFADDAPKTASFGFRFNKDEKREELDAVTAVVKKFAIPLMVGAVDPDDPERGIGAFRKALKEAGMDDLKESVRVQYEAWKDSRK